MMPIFKAILEAMFEAMLEAILGIADAFWIDVDWKSGGRNLSRTRHAERTRVARRHCQGVGDVFETPHVRISAGREGSRRA